MTHCNKLRKIMSKLKLTVNDTNLQGSGGCANGCSSSTKPGVARAGAIHSRIFTGGSPCPPALWFLAISEHGFAQPCA